MSGYIYYMRFPTEKVLRLFLIFLAMYLLFDGGLHLLNIRLQSVEQLWPKSALSYATLLNLIYASFVFLASILIFFAQRELKKYKTMIYASAFWALFHGSLLIYLSITQDFTLYFSDLPSLHVWLPFYSQYLLFESILAYFFSLLVFLWMKGSK